MKKITLVAATLAALLPSLASAETAREAAVEAVVRHHSHAFLAHDWNAIATDYARDAIFTMPDGVIEGKAAIQQFFAGMGAMKAPPVFTVQVLPAVGDVGYQQWVMNPGTPGAMTGVDVFVIRRGKIQFQTSIKVHPVAH